MKLKSKNIIRELVFAIISPVIELVRERCGKMINCEGINPVKC